MIKRDFFANRFEYESIRLRKPFKPTGLPREDGYLSHSRNTRMSQPA